MSACNDRPGPEEQRLLAIQLAQAMDQLPSSDAFARRLDLLLSRGLDPETRLHGLSGVTGKRCVEETPYVLTPLGIAASWLHWHAIEPLLAVCDPDAADPQGRTPLMVCISRFCHETQQADDFDKTFDLLLARSNPHLVDAQGRDALMVACACAKGRAIEALLPLSDPKRRDHAGQNALMIALGAAGAETSQDTQITRAILALAQVSDLRSPNARGQTPAHLATSHLDARVASLFAQPELLRARDSEGHTPLMRAAVLGAHHQLAIFLDASDPQDLDPWGRDALMLAIENGAVEAAKILAPRADLTLADARAERAIDKARLFEQREIEALLAPWDLSQNEAKTLRETSAHSCCSLTPRL